MTTSTNPWTLPGETDDAVLARMEAMIAPTFDDEALPVPASDDAELPWTSGGAAVGIEPDFEVEGLPTLATGDSQLGWTERTGPLTAPGGAPAPPASAAPAPTGSPLPPPPPPRTGAPLPPPAPTGPVSSAASVTAASSTAASSTFAAPDERSAPLGTAAAPPAPDGREPWSAPEAVHLSPVQLPPPPGAPMPADRPWNARPRRGLVVALVLSLVAAVVAVVLIGTRDPETSAPILVPSDPTLADVPGASGAELPLVLPSSSDIDVDFRSSQVSVVTAWAEGEIRTVITGMRSPEAVSVTVEGSEEGTAGRVTMSRRTVVTPRWLFWREPQRWVRSALPAGAFASYQEILGVRAVDDVVPIEVRPLIEVTQATPVDETTTRYVFEFRTGAFRDQYPELFARWLGMHTSGEEVGERTTVVVDVDDRGVVSRVEVEILDGTVTSTIELSDRTVDVAVPQRFVRES